MLGEIQPIRCSRSVPPLPLPPPPYSSPAVAFRDQMVSIGGLDRSVGSLTPTVGRRSRQQQQQAQQRQKGLGTPYQRAWFHGDGDMDKAKERQSSQCCCYCCENNGCGDCCWRCVAKFFKAMLIVPNLLFMVGPSDFLIGLSKIILFIEISV